MTITIQVTDRATPHIAKLQAELDRPGVKHSAGGSVMRLILDHLVALDADRANALGGRRTHFYSQAAKSTSYSVNPAGATVSISWTGFAQRLFGGEIRPVNGKYLTIPARAEAYGRRAREFDNLEVLFGRNGPYALAERESTSFTIRHSGKGEKRKSKIGNRKSHGGGVFYWLVESVSQDPDPTVLPEESVILDTARAAVSGYLRSKGLTS